MQDGTTIVIVGAGPAGLAAARELVRAGLCPIVLEESQRPGGQGTRRLSSLSEPHRGKLFGKDAKAMMRREADEDALLAKCDFRTRTLVWACHENQLELLGPDGFESLAYTHLVLAVGATDRMMPVPGWTLPGVFTLGGAQVALKRHASFIGKKVVFAGASPLLYLAAAQYLRLGNRDLTVLDTTPLVSKARALPSMLYSNPGSTLRGLSLMAELRQNKIAIHTGVTLESFNGQAHVESVEFATALGRKRSIEADAVALGFGLRAETQLAELAGAVFELDQTFRQWFPRTDDMGRAGERLWLAGDSARTGGAEAADAAGQLAAQSLLISLGYSVEARATQKSTRRLRRQQSFQRALTGAFKWPGTTAASLSDNVIVCRCERVTAGDIRAALSISLGPAELNRVKSVTRCGMGRCQGRFCGPALGEIVASVTGQPPGRLRAQAPIRPIPLTQDAVVPEGDS